MKGIAQHIVLGVFVVLALVIIFVKAGQKSGVSGGQQSSQIIGAASQGFASGVTALEGGA